MKMIVRNPTHGIYPATSDYVHAMEVQEPTRFLYVAGTMGLDEKGVAGKSLSEQLDLIWSNIRTILASADMSVDNIVRLTSYLRDPAYAEENAKARVKALNGRIIPTIGIVAQTLSSDWLVEIEVVAAA
ncbi:RidA family protein [Dongia deserti]|uniref:RidA family protein n=1 Tax=Dongia deserti TaxID=2268030 RepID=UPI000E659F0C|nr:RidA family protein [Dongia deserti]